MAMTQSELDILNTTQEVLRHLMLSFAAATRTDPGELATLLQAAAAGNHVSPMASAMLADLASGMAMLQGGGRPKQ